MLHNVSSAVMLSGKGGLCGWEGRHVNSDTPPRFFLADQRGPADREAREFGLQLAAGYGPDKVAAELPLLGGGWTSVISSRRAGK